MRLPALALAALVAGATLTACSSDDVPRTWSDVAEPPCASLTTADLVADAYAGLTVDPARDGVEDGEQSYVATCSVEGSGQANADGATASLPGDLTVAVTVEVLAEGDPTDDLDRLESYADDLIDPASADAVRRSEGELDGWFGEGRWWRTSWVEGGSSPEQLAETAAVAGDNVQVSVVVVERGLAEGSLPAAQERVHALVEAQVAAVEDALERS